MRISTGVVVGMSDGTNSASHRVREDEQTGLLHYNRWKQKEHNPFGKRPVYGMYGSHPDPARMSSSRDWNAARYSSKSAMSTNREGLLGPLQGYFGANV